MPRQFFFPAAQEETRGLGTTLVIKCTLCSFEANQKMYEETETTNRGRKAVKLNIQLASFLTKSSLSVTDLRLLFSALDIPTMSESGIFYTLNTVSKYWENINNEQMTINAKTIQLIKDHRDAGRKRVTCMTDTMYNNPPKGRNMYQPGTQCVSPLVECETSKNLVISLTSFSKLCTKGPRCNNNHPNCTANLPAGKSLAHAEGKSLQENIRDAGQRGLEVCAVVSDGTETKNSNKAGVEKLNCIVHMARAQRRRISNSNFSHLLVGSSKTEKSIRFKQSLSRAISYRSTMILAACRKKFPRQDAKFLKAINNEKNLILDCFSGCHKGCKASIVCQRTERDGEIYSYLPNRQPLQLNLQDRNTLQKHIDFRLNETAALRQRSLQSTNKVESLHLRCLKLTPKSKTYKRNYSYRNHSAIHSDSVGTSTSLLMLLQKINVLPSVSSSFMSIQLREKYHALRQKSSEFKIKRKRHRRERANLKRMSQSFTIHETDVCVPDEHSYCSM